MPGYKSNLAENRAIHASSERGVDVPLAGGMRPLRPGMLGAPRAAAGVPRVKAPRIATLGATLGASAGKRSRRYYGET